MAKRWTAEIGSIVLWGKFSNARKRTLAAVQKIGQMGSKKLFAARCTKVRSGWKASPHIICILKPCLHKKYANTLIQQSKYPATQQKVCL